MKYTSLYASAEIRDHAMNLSRREFLKLSGAAAVLPHRMLIPDREASVVIVNDISPPTARATVSTGAASFLATSR